jgi:multidrug efflux pump subunit AcrA (membrane-fusion protein)
MKGLMGLGLAAVMTFTIGCGNDEEEAQAAAAAAQQQAQEALQQAQAQAAQAQQQAQQAAAQANPAAGGSNFGTITLATGFTPDPHVASGTSGAGASGRDASTLDANCRGQIDSTPDHLFVATTAMSNLRIMANSQSDTTLVIHKPDGTYACNDDGEGLNPIVVIQGAPAGTYQVFVGSYNEGENAAYKLGVSELDSVTPSHANLAL